MADADSVRIRSIDWGVEQPDANPEPVPDERSEAPLPGSDPDANADAETNAYADGYTRGYTDGYRHGYADGDAHHWADTNGDFNPDSRVSRGTRPVPASPVRE